MTALTAPPTPSQLAAVGNPLFDALFIEHTIATLTADYWHAAGEDS